MTDQLVWRKAKASGPEESACVELADLVDVVGVRDSKAPELGHLTLSRSAFAELLGSLGRSSHE
ncbi:DUF397 domain-containing protein [Actinomadura oligospora]|uniref:DUF397 domain-containing protein n=1 Tax=Actinomadura oligospora TaxID=111804 RepID=UPI0009FD2224|nr:DUF397 domain-containing protein [Actinomadura oligospora]